MKFYFGHHKCASTYLHRMILSKVCERVGLNRGMVYSPEQFSGDLDGFVRNSSYDFLCYTNADRKFVQQLQMPFRAVHVIRDPRDVLVSAYFSHLHGHPTKGWPELVEFRRKLQTLDAKEGLLAEIDFIASLPTNGYKLKPLRNMVKWDYSDARVLELRYEEMISDPTTFFTRMGRHLRISGSAMAVVVAAAGHKLWSAPRRLSDAELLDIVEASPFSKLAQRAPKIYRKGQPGDWRHHFDDDITKEFKKTFPGVVTTLGYESDDNW